MGLFKNHIDFEGNPICPECLEPCEADNSNVVASNSTGTWIMHPVCVFKHNEETKNARS